MPRRIKSTQQRPNSPRTFEGFCTACDFEGMVFDLTCPECSRRTIKPGGRK